MTNADKIRCLDKNILSKLGLHSDEKLKDMSNDEIVNYIGMDKFSESVCEAVCGNPENCTDRICNHEIYYWLTKHSKVGEVLE